jgi:hypothetical protein
VGAPTLPPVESCPHSGRESQSTGPRRARVRSAVRPIRRKTSPRTRGRVHKISVTRLLNSIRIAPRNAPQSLPQSVGTLLRLLRCVIREEIVRHGRSPAYADAVCFATRPNVRRRPSPSQPLPRLR